MSLLSIQFVYSVWLISYCRHWSLAKMYVKRGDAGASWQAYQALEIAEKCVGKDSPWWKEIDDLCNKASFMKLNSDH